MFKYVWIIILILVSIFGWAYSIYDIVLTIRNREEDADIFDIFHDLEDFTQFWITIYTIGGSINMADIETLTDKEKAILKYLLKIGDTMACPLNGIRFRIVYKEDENVNSYEIKEIAEKLGIDL